MKENSLDSVIKRSMNDEVFLDALLVNPQNALKEFDLSSEDLEVIVSGNELRLYELLGTTGTTGNINSNQYHHSKHKGGIGGYKPDLLPREVSK